MKNLIVYYSLTGNNAALADILKARLKCDVLKIEEKRRRTTLSIFLDRIFGRSPKLKRYELTISHYDHITLVAPVWAGKVCSPMETFLKQEKLHIQKYSLISLCGGTAGQKERITDHLSLIMGKEPLIVQELWISRLPSQASKAQLNYRVGSDDWKTFQPGVDQFLEALTREVRLPVEAEAI